MPEADPKVHGISVPRNSMVEFRILSMHGRRVPGRVPQEQVDAPLGNASTGITSLSGSL